MPTNRYFSDLWPIWSNPEKILDAWSVKRTLSLTATFYLTKTKNKNKKSLTQLSYFFAEC